MAVGLTPIEGIPEKVGRDLGNITGMETAFCVLGIDPRPERLCKEED